MSTPEPLEKQLFALDLSKGMDQRTRPELLNGPNNVTLIENLVQDQTGGWVKRPGTVQGPTSDGSGTSAQPAAMRKALALLKGWAIIADGGRLLHKQDAQNKFRTREELMDFGAVSGSLIGSAGPYGQVAFSKTEGNIQNIASCETHDAFVSYGLGTVASSNGASQKLFICERATGVEYQYDLGKVTDILGGSVTTARMAFVGNRYLHVYVLTTGPTVRVIVIDVLGTMPATESAITPVTVVNAAGTNLNDAVGGDTRGFVLTYNSTTTVATVWAINASTGAVIESKAGAATQLFTCLALNQTQDRLWLMQPSAAAAGGLLLELQASSITTVITAAGIINEASLFGVDESNNITIICSSTATFGGATLTHQSLMYKPAAQATPNYVGTFWGWTIISHPFHLPGSDKFYAHAVKDDATSAIATHAIIDLSSFTLTPYDLPEGYGSVRLACVLEPFVGLRNAGADAMGFTATTGAAWHIKPWNDYDVAACVPYQTAQRTSAGGFLHLRLADAAAYGHANFSGSTYIGHGGLNAYDGASVVEQGMVDMPVADVAVLAAVGNVDGSVRYVVVYRYVDSNGASTYSRTYGPLAAVNVAGATGQNLVTIQAVAVTNMDDGKNLRRQFVELYRTKNGGTQYYLCASSQENMAGSTTSSVQQIAQAGATGTLTVTDNLSDATLGAQAVMYRQPGTTNAPADRYTAPCTKMVIQHKDRLFCVDPYGQRVYYSSFFVDGEAAWFNPAFNFYVHAGSGPITGLASMDGRLIVFKKDAVFVVDGDGPGEAGPTGNEYSPPQALAARYGCVDHRSIVVGPQGIAYRSTRGFELLNRSLKVTWVGEAVWELAESFPVTTGSCIDSDGRIHFTLAASEGTEASAATAGVELVYDMPTESWTSAKYTGSAGVYGRCKQSCAVVVDDDAEKVVYCDADAGTYLASAALGNDGAVYVPWTVESGWIKLGPQVRQRISNVLVLAKKYAAANHAMKLSLAFDYVDSYVQQTTWEPDVLNALAIEEICIKPSKQLLLAIKLKIEEIEPDDTATYPIGTGRGAALLGATAEMAAVHGAPFANRGTLGVLSTPPSVAGIVPATGSTAGSTAVAIYGVGFTAGTTFTIGGVAATSVVFVSSTKMTAVTPAGTAGAKDVVALNSGGTGTLTAGYLYVAATFDPATLAASIWLKPGYAVPWPPGASAGPSAFTGPFVTNLNDPSVTTLNGFNVARFDGANDNLVSQFAYSRAIWSPSAGGIFLLFRPIGAGAAPTGSVYNDANIIMDTAAVIGVSYTTAGIAGWSYDGTFRTNPIVCANGSWHSLMFRWDGVNIGMTLDSAAEVNVACGANNNLGATLLQLGYQYAVGGRYDGDLAEVICFQGTPTPTNYSNWKSYVNTTYGLSL